MRVEAFWKIKGNTKSHTHIHAAEGKNEKLRYALMHLCDTAPMKTHSLLTTSVQNAFELSAPANGHEIPTLIVPIARKSDAITAFPRTSESSGVDFRRRAKYKRVTTDMRRVVETKFEITAGKFLKIAVHDRTCLTLTSNGMFESHD